MKTIEQLLTEIGVDKTEDINTTSLKFKQDLWEYFQDCQDKVAVEFGTHKGQTTRILSFLFKKVYTINNNDNEIAKDFNSDRNNISYLNFDLYSNRELPIDETIDMFLIDAGHKYYHVMHDVKLATSANCSENCYIVFDDYGCNVHRDEVKRAVDEIISQNIVKVEKGIGHGVGKNFGSRNPGGQDRILEDHEGLITKIIK